MSEITSFKDFNLSPALEKDIEKSGYVEPTPIQKAAIPIAMEGLDILGQAHTGTGKTAAFSLPMIMNIDSKARDVQGLVLTPTRELAIQVAGEIFKLGKSSKIKELPIYGGQNISHQIRALKNNPHIIVGTPGRIIDHLNRGTLKLDKVSTLVLDEADEMLDMGFIEDIEFILQKTPREKHTMLFSATVPPALKKVVNKYMNVPKIISVIQEGEKRTATNIEQIFYEVPEHYKLEALCRLLDFQGVEFAMIFCRTKKDCSDLSNNLNLRGYLSEPIHGDLTQEQRNRVMDKFKKKKLEYLVATDVAARGIDVANVTHVINYHIPQNPEDYIHRIGRTGRAGQNGCAITIISPKEFGAIRSIERLTKSRIQKSSLPSVKDVLVKQEEFLEARIKGIVEKGDLEIYTKMIEKLSDSFSMEMISATLLKMYFDDKQILVDEIPERQYQDKRRDGRDRNKGQDRYERGGKISKLFLTVGREDGIDVSDVYRGIVNSSSINKKSIGRIKLYDRFSFVEVTSGDINDILYELQNLTVEGIKVKAEIAKARKN
ncbi:MAG: DEAD/DEAH box helicase [Nitrospinae bacterium]|nr:DEAD/DEAH box helicase [Nitrospinota bacterium]